MRQRKRRGPIINDCLKEKLELAKGLNHITWLLIQDVPSEGLVVYGKGWRARKTHHNLLSALERDYFFSCEWDLFTK